MPQSSPTTPHRSTFRAGLTLLILRQTQARLEALRARLAAKK